LRLKGLSKRLVDWYDGGERGLLTICETDGAPQAVTDAVRRWFELGRLRMQAIADEIEEAGDE
jgi:hypothetical protein